MIETPRQFVQAYSVHGSIRAIALAHSMSRHKVTKLYLAAKEQNLIDAIRVGNKSREQRKDPLPVMAGTVKAMRTPAFPLPKKGEVKRYLLSYAQNNTEIFEPLWENLMALVNHPKLNCTLMIARGTYSKVCVAAADDKDRFMGKERDSSTEYSWDSRVVDYLHDSRAEIAPGLVWCGEMNIMPTAVRPLSSMESYTGRKSAILPHPKICLESIASGKYENTKFNYTTGAVTMRNYIKRKAGLKADFHHSYGALLVEVNSEGAWWCRQLNADSEGTIFDLGMRVEHGTVYMGSNVEAINWGDIHHIRLDSEVKELCWGKGGILDSLKPKYQFFNDILDFRSRNHHERGQAYKLLERYVEQEDDVEQEVESCMDFLEEVTVDYCSSVVVDSNHDQALSRWLQITDGHYDPVNMEFWHEANLQLVRAIKNRDKFFSVLEWCYSRGGRENKNIKFLAEDESFVICPDAHGGIECGMHGHRGPNGSFGNALGYAKMGRKCNIGHSHTARILEGVYYAGVMADLDLGYNVGPSSWSRSMVITYPNGKRAIVTIWNGEYRA